MLFERIGLSSLERRLGPLRVVCHASRSLDVVQAKAGLNVGLRRAPFDHLVFDQGRSSQRRLVWCCIGGPARYHHQCGLERPSRTVQVGAGVGRCAERAKYLDKQCRSRQVFPIPA